MKDPEQKIRFILLGVALAGMVPMLTLHGLEDDPFHTEFARFHTYERELNAFQSVNELIVRLGVSCFYLAPKDREDDGSTLSMDQACVTPAEVLDAVVVANPRLIWVPVDNRLVNVLPVALVEDPESVLYHPVSGFAVENVSFREAVSAVTACVPKELRYGGFVGGSMGGLPGGGTIFDRKVTVRLVSGTYLDLVNALMKAAGDDVGVLASGPTGFMPVKTYQSRAETAALARAESYMKIEGQIDRDEAVAWFDAALVDAPYTALKKLIQFHLAELYMGSDGRLAYKVGDATPNPEKALPIFTKFAVPREASDLDAGIYNQCCDYAVTLLLDQGRVEEARRLLESVLNEPFSVRLVDPEAIYANLIGIRIWGMRPQEAVFRLTSMRDEEPENEHFHRALESRLRQEMASIE